MNPRTTSILPRKTPLVISVDLRLDLTPHSEAATRETRTIMIVSATRRNEEVSPFVVEEERQYIDGYRAAPDNTFSHVSKKEPIRWGILCAGKISSDFAKAIAITEGAEVVAVAARSSAKAESFARNHGIPKAFGCYADLLNDPSVHVVYIGSIADQHYHLAVQSLLAKKPTVVEKPLTLTLKDTQSLIRLAKQSNVFLMEGLWTRSFPAILRVQELIAEGTIGRVSTIQADFGWSTEGCGPGDRIWQQGSGGMTLDIGKCAQD